MTFPLTEKDKAAYLAWLLWPDVCHVVAPGVVEFRGQEIVV